MPWNVRRWAYLILPAARRTGVPAAMIAAVMTVESEGDPLAWNTQSDARGLMQILHGPWDPQTNIDIGAQMLAGFYAQFGNWILALAAYNAGPNAVIAAGGVPNIAETRDYVVMVPYLYALYSHHPLSVRAVRRFRRVLHDYQRRVRRHIRHAVVWRLNATGPSRRVLEQRLRRATARGGHQRQARVERCRASCARREQASRRSIEDPFWPLAIARDPLPLVSPGGAYSLSIASFAFGATEPRHGRSDRPAHARSGTDERRETLH